MIQQKFYATGKRKNSIAKVLLFRGNGNNPRLEGQQTLEELIDWLEKVESL